MWSEFVFVNSVEMIMNQAKLLTCGTSMCTMRSDLCTLISTLRLGSVYQIRSGPRQPVSRLLAKLTHLAF